MLGSMTFEERLAFLRENRTLILATIGPAGRPHLAPLWYGIRPDGSLTAWTRGGVQKVHNLARLPEATVLVEDGTDFSDIRGVSMECAVTIVREPAEIREIGRDIMERYMGPPQVSEERDAFLDAHARVRVGLLFVPTKTTSWDHTKVEQPAPPLEAPAATGGLS